MADRASLEGSLGFVGLADLFQILGGNAGTGILEITTPYAPHPGLIYFSGGNPINAACGHLNGLEAVYALFGWTDGRFQFREEEVRAAPVIKQARMQIVLDALRMVDDGAVQKVGPSAPARARAGTAEPGPSDGKAGPQLVKGPLVDYAFIIGEEEFREGEKILREGGHGKWIWVILEGAVEVRRETPAGPLPVARLGEGCFIGTFAAFLFKEHPRSASIVTLATVRLGLLDTERLSKIFTSLSPDMRAVLVSLDNRLREVTDRAVEFHLGETLPKGFPKAKDRVIEMGSSREDLFIIQEGEAVVVGQSRKGSLPLAALEKEDVFGFLPFLDMGHEPREAAIAASGGLKTRPLDVETLHMEHKQLPATFKHLIYHMGVSIFSTTRSVQQMHERG